MLTLAVKDDGVGMSDDYNWKESDSLGLRLINSLVDQVGGTIAKEPGEGTMFIITLHRKTIREHTP
jgi:two-component sensor histidine kinase